MTKKLYFAILPLILGMSQPASADVLYTNGPVDGNTSGRTINYGYAVADSFTLSAASTLTGVDFSTWNFPGDVISAVDWSIISDPVSVATTYASGTASVTSSLSFVNGFGYDINTNSFTLNNISLAAGTYFLELQNAVIASGDPVFWDENRGPSVAWQTSTGYLTPANTGCPVAYCSQTFDITGASSAIPEPTSLTLLMIGLTGFGLRKATRKFG